MATALRWSVIGVGVFAGLALAALLYVYFSSEQIIGRTYPLPPSHIQASGDPQSIARGQRLARAYGCADCHGHNLQGAFIPDFGMTSRNLTQLSKSFSDADFDRAVRHGLRPDGTSVAEYMPSDAFQFMPDSDLADILSYLRSLPARGADIPAPSYGIVARVGFLTGKSKTDIGWFALQRPALDLGARYARGRTLAMTACGECHTTALQGGVPQGPGAPPNLSIVASYDRSDFFKFMRTGKAAGNRELPMMSAVARVRISHLDDDEIGAIYDYLAARGKKLTSASN